MKTNILFTSLFCATAAFSQSQPEITRIEGKGNGGLVIDFTDPMHGLILGSSTHAIQHPEYKSGKGPFTIDIYDSTLTPSGDYYLVFDDPGSSATDAIDDGTSWHLVHLPSGNVVYSDSTLADNYLQDIPAWGMKIKTELAKDPGDDMMNGNGFLEATRTFDNPAQNWLSGYADVDGATDANWIRSGIFPAPVQYKDYPGVDEYSFFENIVGRTWAPYRLCAFSNVALNCYNGPAWEKYIVLSQLRQLASVDIVFTSDQSKWSRCVVLETCDEEILAQNGAKKLSLRKAPSVDKSGAANFPSADNDDFPTGMGWFPGYAVNIETGERLNIAFGEDSYLSSENGRDMVWNPTSNVAGAGRDVIGGKHYIYVFGHNGDNTYIATDPYLSGGLRDVPKYDSCRAIQQLLEVSDATTGSISDSYKREVFADAMWVNVPLLAPGHTLLETDVLVRLRVSKKYRKYLTDNSNNSRGKYLFNPSDVTGIEGTDGFSMNLNIYPNPAAEAITLEYAHAGPMDVRVYDVKGTLVVNRKINSGDKLNLGSLSPGTYLVNISNGRESATQVVLKQ